MKVFHGSLVQVGKPEIREPIHTLDYGKGFYTTTSYEQAEAWVKRKMNEKISDFYAFRNRKGFSDLIKNSGFAQK